MELYTDVKKKVGGYIPAQIIPIVLDRLEEEEREQVKLTKNKFLVDALTDKNIETKYMGFCQLKNKQKHLIRRIDIRYIPYNSYYTALLYFTGSDNYNKKMRDVAISMGYKLNEYGLFKLKKDDSYSDTPVKVKSEKDIFKKLKLDYLEPHERG